MTRINQKFTRLYWNGYDISGYASNIGALDWLYDVSPTMAMSDEVMNGVAGRVNISAGAINSFLDNDTAGLMSLAKTATGTTNLMVAYGTNAVPATGNPVFAWEFERSSYQTAPSESFTTANINVGSASFSSTFSYQKPWGVLLHAKGAETAVNSAAGVDDYGAQTTAGGIFVYHLFSSNGTVTLKAQDASTNSDGSFGDLSGATSGSIDASVSPASDMIALGTGATVKRYLRWQLVFGTATTATFAMALIRA